MHVAYKMMCGRLQCVEIIAIGSPGLCYAAGAFVTMLHSIPVRTLLYPNIVIALDALCTCCTLISTNLS